MLMRDLNMETSLSVFLGPYLTEGQMKEINHRYWLITVALELVNFPFAFPGTKVYNAMQARKLVMRYLEAASANSKIRMADPTAEPECLLDAWTKAMVTARQKRETEQDKLLEREYTDHEIAMVVLSFLFASQDAMSSAIVYAFQLTADHPEILAKIREEQYRVRGNDVDAPLTLDLVDDMVYTRAAIKETLRLMPPVIMASSLRCACQKQKTDPAGPVQDHASFPHHTGVHRSQELYAYSRPLPFSPRRIRLP